MPKLVWFIPQPAQDIEGYEDWYQNEHIPRGMRQEHLQRFRVNRSFYPQPECVVQMTGSERPKTYRFSEGYWNSVEDMQSCYVSVHGRAALADGPLNIPPPAVPVSQTPSPVLIMEEEIFPVPEELAFNLREGRYRAPLACKLFGFVRLKNGKAEEFDRRYGALASAISSDGALRGHTLSRTLDAVIRPGRAVQWPPVGSERFDRAVEYYFESPEAMGQFCAAGRLKCVTDLFSELGEACFWDATRIQEIFYTAIGDQPLEESWKALYPR